MGFPPWEQQPPANRIFNFCDQCDVGEHGELEFLRFMDIQLRKGIVKQVIDVRKNEKYQDTDIDFISLNANGERVLWEVKTDTRTTGNIFLEQRVTTYVKNDNTGQILYKSDKFGWAHRSQANTIFYFCENLRQVIIFDRLQMNDWVDWVFGYENLHSPAGCKVKPFQTFSALNKEKEERLPPGQSKYYYGVGYAVPIRDIRKAKKLKGYQQLITLKNPLIFS